jgi:hypothetical protein
MHTKHVLAILAIGLFCLTGVHAQSNNQTTVAIEIVYDGSGSMGDSVPGLNGESTPKFVIASNAIVNIANQIHTFVKTKHAQVEAGLVPFYGGEVRAGLPLRKFNQMAFILWAQNIPSPDGGTPLGRAIKEASSQLSKSSASKKFILIVTDGESNAGPEPATVLSEIKNTQPVVKSFFVAFDVNADVFSGAKTQGATVVSAANATELTTQINNLLGQKILLEAE